MTFVLAIQSFINSFANTIISLVRILVLTKWSENLKKYKLGKECVILGNGPSLVDSIREHRGFFEKKNLICVNHFPTTDLYESLKPEYFIASAPDLYYENIDEEFIVNSEKLFDAIHEKTYWKLHLFMPFEAKRYKRWQRKIKDNEMINIVYYNTTPIEGWQWFRHFLFKLNWGMPRPHNIMIPSIFLTLNMGYKKIYLTGVDHSWLPEITVDDQNNALINQKHFYDSLTSKATRLDKKGIGARKLHEILHKFMLAFKGYFVLLDYSKDLDSKIYNTTAKSYIDAFERIKL